MATGKEVTTIPEEGRYLVAYDGRMDELRQVVEDNIGNDGIVPRELPRIRIPAGGGTAWEVPTLEGPEAAQRIELVIAHWKTMRAYWPIAFEQGSGQPPDCTSDDGLVGIGNPGVICKICTFNQFGSAKEGTGVGKACREVRALFVLGAEDAMPYFMPLPPMSIQPVRQYFAKLTQKSIPFWAVETVFTLEQDKNRDGIRYSKASISLGRMLNENERARMASYREFLRPAFDAQTLTAEDVSAA